MSETTATKPLSYYILIIAKMFKNSLKSCNSYIIVQFLLMYFTVLITHFSAYLSIGTCECECVCAHTCTCFEKQRNYAYALSY